MIFLNNSFMAVFHPSHETKKDMIKKKKEKKKTKNRTSVSIDNLRCWLLHREGLAFQELTRSNRLGSLFLFLFLFLFLLKSFYYSICHFTSFSLAIFFSSSLFILAFAPLILLRVFYHTYLCILSLRCSFIFLHLSFYLCISQFYFPLLLVILFIFSQPLYFSSLLSVEMILLTLSE
jgi:hypothetical protein